MSMRRAKLAGQMDLRDIRAAALGNHATVHQHHAIDELADSSWPTAHRDLETVLTDESAETRLRYLAAVALARTDREASEEILIKATTYRDARIRAGVLRSLGRIGGQGALEAIERVLPKTEGATRRQGEFAATLIAHRLGLPSHGIPTAAAGDRLELASEAGDRIRIGPPIKAEAHACLETLGLRPYRVELAERPMYQVRCGRCTGMVLLNRDYVGSDALGILAKRKALFAVGALRDPFHPEYSPALVFLTEPEGAERIRISVHLTNGDQIFVGEAGVRGEVASWALRAVRRLGAFPIRAEGEFRGGRLEIKMAASARRVVLQTRPRLMIRSEATVLSASSSPDRLPERHVP
jgi:hypothetical protein